MSVELGIPDGTTGRFPRVGSRRSWSSGLLLAGGAATLLGICLPWGHGVGITVTGLSPSMAVFALALGVVGILAVVCGGFVLTHADAAGWVKAGSLGCAVLGIAAWLILPAGVDVAAGYQSAVGPVVFDVGAWIVATGIIAVVTGAMLLCTRRRTSTVVALMLPLVAAVLTLIELQ